MARGDHLKTFQFKPGQSGNPAGRRPGSKKSFAQWIEDIAAEEVDAADGTKKTKAEVLARVLFRELLAARPAFWREFLAREWPATLHLSGSVDVGVSTEDALEQLEASLTGRAAQAAHVNGAGAALSNGHDHDEGGSR
jgi:hypothetical protein